MTFGSLFSGIGGFDLGLERAGMRCAWQVEADARCRSVLERHWPTVERYDDVRTVGAADLARVDLVCGGFPCQDLSVAGQRAGLAGERSGLWFEFRRIVEFVAPRWVLIENVPGLLSSDGGRDFATVVRGLVQLGYGVCWRVLDAQFAGLAQRRDRVFVVGGPGDGGAAPVLFEPSSVRWDPPPRRTSREGAARPLAGGSPNSGGYRNDADTAVSSPVLASAGHHGRSSPRGDGRDNLVAFDTTQITSATNRCQPAPGDPCHPLPAHGHAPSIAATVSSKWAKGTGGPAGDEAQNLVADTITGNENRVTNGGGNNPRPPNVLTVALRGREGGNMAELGGDVANALRGPGGGSSAPMALADPIKVREWDASNNAGRLHNVVTGVRRLMPIECERLQGFPDGWTSGQKDAPRYRQLGNAVAVPVAEWIGRRIATAHVTGTDGL